MNSKPSSLDLSHGNIPLHCYKLLKSKISLHKILNVKNSAQQYSGVFGDDQNKELELAAVDSFYFSMGISVERPISLGGRTHAIHTLIPFLTLQKDTRDLRKPALGLTGLRWSL